MGPKRKSKTSALASAGVEGEALVEAQKSTSLAALKDVTWLDLPACEIGLRLRPDLGSTFKAPDIDQECLYMLRAALMEKKNYIELKAGIFDCDKDNPPFFLHVLHLIVMGDGTPAIIVRFEDYTYQGGEGRFMVVVPLPLKSGRPPRLKSGMDEVFLGNDEIALLKKYSESPADKVPDLNPFVKKYFDDRGPREVAAMLKLPITGVIEELKAKTERDIVNYINTNTGGQANTSAKVRAQLATSSKKTFDALAKVQKYTDGELSGRFKLTSRVRTRDEYTAERATSLAAIARKPASVPDKSSGAAGSSAAPSHTQPPAPARAPAPCPGNATSLLEKRAAATADGQLEKPPASKLPPPPPRASGNISFPTQRLPSRGTLASARPQPAALPPARQPTAKRSSPRRQAAEAETEAADSLASMGRRPGQPPKPPVPPAEIVNLANTVLNLSSGLHHRPEPPFAADFAGGEHEEEEEEEEEEQAEEPSRVRGPRGGIDESLMLVDRTKRQRLTVAEAAARDAAVAAAASAAPGAASSGMLPPVAGKSAAAANDIDAAKKKSGGKKNQSRIGMSYNTSKRRIDAVTKALQSHDGSPLTSEVLSKLLTPGAAVAAGESNTTSVSAQAKIEELEAQLAASKASNTELQDVLSSAQRELVIDRIKFEAELTAMKAQIQRLEEEQKKAVTRAEESLERGIAIGMRSSQNSR